MARDQKNFENYLYVDDNAVEWTKRGEVMVATTAIDGHAAQTGKPTWIDGPRMRARSITWQDPTTFRSVRSLIYTAAAFAAIDLGDVIAVPVAGLATTVNFAAVKKNAERQPARANSRKLLDA
jgi:hypothetical protein